MTHETFEEQAAAYAFGVLDAGEVARFEAHLAEGCALCTAALAESSHVMLALARKARPVHAPAGVRDALLRRVAADADRRRPTAASYAWWWTPWAAAAAAAVLVAVLSALLVTGRYEERLAALARETAALRAELDRQAASVGERAADVAIAQMLRDPATRVLALHGAGPSPSAEARLVWQPRSGGWLVVTNLPPAGPGKAYELWTISGGQPSPAGVFQVDAAGRATHRVDAVRKSVDVFAVTVEPEKGMPAPTGPIVLASK